MKLHELPPSSASLVSRDHHHRLLDSSSKIMFGVRDRDRDVCRGVRNLVTIDELLAALQDALSILTQSISGMTRAITIVRCQWCCFSDKVARLISPVVLISRVRDFRPGVATVGDLRFDGEDDLRDLGRSFAGVGDSVDLRRLEKMVEGQNWDF
ncbi:hypothetical protein TIFTF001_005981 [Ficus carica]|uniref:Uncharacterized protein n=1 Tax=Ficus carica TaxID=3494 RepID=A0AA87ZGE3_FICCA|nr:hypothetical protein TIFTF001_005981 [Ficus carica]